MTAVLKYCLRHQPMMLVVFFVTLLGTVWLVIATPKGFFPQEDIGQLSVSTEARQDISFAGDGGLAAAGRGRISGARPTWPTSPRSSARREEAQASTTAACSSSSSRATSALPCRRCWPTCAATRRAFRASAPIATPVQNLRIGGRSSRAEYQFVMQGLNRAQLYEWSQKMADAMGRDPHFADVNSDLQINATQATLIVDKDKASSLGHLGGAAALHALFRLRQPADLHHLRHRRQLLRGDGVHRQDQLDHCRAARRPHSQFRRQAGADRRLRTHRANGGLAHYQSAGTASRCHHLVQPASGRRLG